MFSIVFYFLIHFILVFLNAFFIIGLQRLASQLQNPFVIVLLLLLHYSQAYN